MVSLSTVETGSIDQLLRLARDAHAAGKLAEAERLYRAILQRKPDHPDALHLLGVLAHQVGRPAAGAELMRRAIALQPAHLPPRANLAMALIDSGHLAEAADVCRAALAIDPSFDRASMNLASALFRQGRASEAIDVLRGVVAARPDHVRAHSVMLYCMMFDPRYSPQQIFAEHRAWAERFADPLTPPSTARMLNDPPSRRLRIGCVTSGFREHPIGRAMMPLLAHHDHARFEIFCYCDNAADELTSRLRQHADTWRDVTMLSNEQLADQIRSDAIDILVDLSLHMEGERLLAFARKPAPVQASFLGYAATTGLAAMDYRITDRHLDPPGQTETLGTETLIRLPQSFYCWVPDGTEPEVQPRAEHEPITFGSLNFPPKVSSETIALWSRVLDAVPNSRLTLVTYERSAAGDSHFAPLFERRGIARDRLHFVTPVPRTQYLARYHEIDVALDPFPYNGGVTTLDALWMGVPVLTLAGDRSVGRLGVSILSTLGLPELIARDEDHYIGIAAGLANDRPRLRELRSTLRHRMRTSPLTDGQAFARAVESAYLTMSDVR